ncbi:MAG: patatin-like phospholipase family protein [Candidatus Omnitrophica bacterium]|nr:patatin-like phospholipase family protein [Candidatus Omnitrophota bacterium]MDD5487350.1 patatin-like phospholipase family protein [Candidatus Omnitrophota bacterium]
MDIFGRFGKKVKKVLALGGGGARGLSNIGVLKTLERNFGKDRLPFDMIVGTSIGSLIGAAYSLGMSPEEMEKEAVKFSWPNIVDIGVFSTGLIRGSKFEGIIVDMVKNKSFNEMKIPFALTTTDIETGEELVHTSGDLVKLIRASCSWPGIFSAVEIDGRLLVDGGVRNSIPTKAAYGFGAKFVLAVNPGFAVKNQKVNNVITALIQSVQIMGEELNAYQSRGADIAIKPELHGVDQFDFDKADEIIKQGEIAAEKVIRSLKLKLSFML